MRVKDYLPKVKANRHTYYNLNNSEIIRFKNLYNYLKKNKEKEVSNYFQWNDAVRIVTGKQSFTLIVWI